MPATVWPAKSPSSPSATGAYRFEIVPGATLIMDIDSAIYPRKAIERLGIAPLTSMYQHGENDRRVPAKVLTERDMERLGMGALLAVARGAVEPAKLIVLEYRGDARRAALGIAQVRPQRDQRRGTGSAIEQLHRHVGRPRRCRCP